MSPTSPISKRQRIDSPNNNKNDALALPGSSWKPNNPSNSLNNQQGGNKSTHGVSGQTELPTPPEERPLASGSGTANVSHSKAAQTDFESINDAVGISGVDIAAEEELARQQSVMYNRTGGGRSNSHSQNSWSNSQPQQRVKIMDFLDKPALTVMVQHIAASYQLKTLEPAILDVLTQAAEHRIHSLIIDSIAAKDHRIGSSHLRPPPLYQNLPPPSIPKGKQKEKEPQAMYDQLIYDEPERILSMLARVEGEEERKARTDRELMKSKASSSLSGENVASNNNSQDPGVSENNQNSTTNSSTGNDPNRNLPPDQSHQNQEQQGSDKFNRSSSILKKGTEKKRKREGPAQQAKNISDDARARQSNQTAMRSVGGRSKYSWLSGGVVNPIGKVRTNNPSIMASLPAPKFAPQSSSTLNTNHKLNNTNNTSDLNNNNSNTKSNDRSEGTNNHLNKKENNKNSNSSSNNSNCRLGGILPGSHLNNKEPDGIGLKDCLFALERERGSGAGRGTGSKTLFKTYVVGRVKD